MKSIVYEGTQQVVATQRPIPEVGEGEVLIKVAYAGICGSDMFIYQGTHPRAQAPLIMGHEFSGVIEKGHPTLAKGPRKGPPRAKASPPQQWQAPALVALPCLCVSCWA